MHKTFILLISLICIFGCKTSTDTAAEVTEVVDVIKNSEKKDTQSKQIKTMKLNPLESYFPELPFTFYENCHEEKGSSEDFFKGTKIPTELAAEHILYKIASIPKLGMKRKVNSPDVEFRAVGKMKSKNAYLLFYKIGINCRTENDNDDLGYETRLAVLRDGKVVDNYFVGGHKSTPSGSMSVCRNVELTGDKITFTLNKDASMEVPSILRLDDNEEKNL